MELFEELKKYNIPDVRITKEEWREKYANTYNILAIREGETTVRFAAEDIIKIYLLEQAKLKETALQSN